MKHVGKVRRQKCVTTDALEARHMQSTRACALNAAKTDETRRHDCVECGQTADQGVTYLESKRNNCHSYSYSFKQTGEVVAIKPSVTLSMKLTALSSSRIDL